MEISILQCILGLLMMAVPCYLMYYFNVKLLDKTLRSCLKMVSCLAVLGVMLYYVVWLNHIVVTLLFGLLLMFIAAVLTVRRAKMQLRQMFIPVLTGILAGVVPVGAYFLLLVMGQKQVVEVHYFIPIIGLLAGYGISVNGRALHFFDMGLRHHGHLYRYLLANGNTHSKAVAYLFRRTIERSVLPSVSNMSLMVVVSLPLMMWMLMLSGTSVVVAVAYQALLMIAMLCSSTISVVVTLLVCKRYMLDGYHQMKETTPYEIYE